MKKFNQPILIILAIMLVSNISYGQIAAVKKFDYTILESKTLYIPTFAASERFIKKMSKKGKFDKIADAKARAELYNEIWKKAMAESSYDATDYEIKAFDRDKLIKSKDPKAVLLYFRRDDYGNWSAHLMVTAPYKMIIASTIINGLDLFDKNDLRLMMNMLNESLHTAAEVNEEGDEASRRNIKTKYKQALVDWYQSAEDKTFLVPKSEHSNEKKAAKRNAQLKEALKEWNLSKSEFTTEEEINKRRLEGDPDSYYWRTFPIYTNNPLLTYNYNVILSTENDDLIIGFLGKSRLKPATIKKIQKKVVQKITKYERQLAG